MTNLRNFFRTIFGRIMVALAVVLACAGSATFFYETAHKNVSKRFMADLSAQLLERVELSADYAILTLVELTSNDLGSCKTETLFDLREALYLRGPVKNVVVLGSSGQVLCSGLPHSLGENIIDLSLSEPFVGSNNSISFHNISNATNGLMGIAWKFKTFTAVAILNVDALLFDAFPALLRDLSTAHIGFDANNFVASRGETTSGTDGTFLMFDTESSRYPLLAQLAVAPEVLSTYDRPFEKELVLGAAFAGLMFGILIAQLLARPTDPKADIKCALKSNEFKPFVQPLFSLSDNRIIGGEALMRWIKPDGTIISPLRFIPLAEDSGLIIPMTRAIIKETLYELGDILERDPHFKISFNIVPSDLCAPGFMAEMQALVADSKASASQIVIELTERQELEDLQQAAKIINDLRDLGFRTALDDTGTGHNGLSYVQDLGADIIKIDKKFVDFVSDQGGDEIVKMLVTLAKSMNMITIAEGIETEEQARVLTALGVDQGQGYLISKPVHPAAFCALVDEQYLAYADRPSVKKSAA